MLPLRKLKAITLYFANNTNKLGTVKLNKLFYFLDFGFVKQYAVPITYDTYIKKKNGPVPSVIDGMVHAVLNGEESDLSDVITVRPIDIQRDNPMFKVLPSRSITAEDLEYLSDDEQKWLTAVAERFKNSTSDEIEEASHKEAPWNEVSMNAQIPYFLAAHDSDSRVTEQEILLALS